VQLSGKVCYVMCRMCSATER